jgi:hypothetical protein
LLPVAVQSSCGLFAVLATGLANTNDEDQEKYVQDIMRLSRVAQKAKIPEKVLKKTINNLTTEYKKKQGF